MRHASKNRVQASTPSREDELGARWRKLTVRHTGKCWAEGLLQQGIPRVNLAHFRALNDGIGIIQYAPYSKPDLTWGYTTDDVARALVFVCRAGDIMEEPEQRTLVRKYVAFLDKMRTSDGRWSNEMRRDGSVADAPSGRDHPGRAAWAAGCYANSQLWGERAWGRRILDAGLQWALDTSSPRAKAYFLLGACEFLKVERNAKLLEGATNLAKQLLGWYQAVSRLDWRWFEDILAYDNARLPESLAAWYEITKDSASLEVASGSLEFLVKVQTVQGVFAPIGNKGWYRVGEYRALYDQQPDDAGATVEACNRLHRITGQKHYLDWSSFAFSWYSGFNLKRLAVYDSATGGCYDGLTKDGLNLNQGAESVLSYLLAVTSF